MKEKMNAQQPEKERKKATTKSHESGFSYTFNGSTLNVFVTTLPNNTKETIDPEKHREFILIFNYASPRISPTLHHEVKYQPLDNPILDLVYPNQPNSIFMQQIYIKHLKKLNPG